MPIKTQIAAGFDATGAASDWKFTELRAVVTAKDSGVLIMKTVGALSLRDEDITLRDITLLQITPAGLRQLADELAEAIAADVGPAA